MSLVISVAVAVAMPDGSTIVSVGEVDTSINPAQDDPAAEVLLAKKMVERLVESAQTRSIERLDELDGVIGRMMGAAE